MSPGVDGRRRMVVVASALGLAFSLALAGCATGESPGGGSPGGGSGGDPGDPGVGPTPEPTTTAEPVLRRPLMPVTARELLEYCPATDAEHFDGDTAAVLDVYVCSASDILTIDGGEGTQPDVQRASRVISGGDELLTAYSAPNAPATTGACIQLAADPLIVWLRTASGITPVYAPVDECGFPTPPATDAFNGVELETILEIRAD